jgi:hypothetical protein
LNIAFTFARGDYYDPEYISAYFDLLVKKIHELLGTKGRLLSSHPPGGWYSFFPEVTWTWFLGKR